MLGLMSAGQAALAQEAPALRDWDAIKRRGQLLVALYKDNEPFSFGAPESMQGLDVDLAQALAREMGLPLRILPFPAGEDMHADLRHMVTRGHYLGYGPADIMFRVPVDMHLMMANRLALIFSTYHREVPACLIDRRRLSSLQGPEDLRSHTIACERGMGLTSALLGYGNGLLKERIRLYDSGVLAARAVLSGEADAAYVTRSQAEYVLGQRPVPSDSHALVDLRVSPSIDRGWPIGLAIKSQHHELRRQIESAMKKLHERGEILDIFRKYKITLVL